MSRTLSTMLALGTRAPEFTLPEPATGKNVSLSDMNGSDALLVVFMCNHCPYVIHLQPALPALIREFQEKGLKAVAISANDVDNYPDDSPDKMIALAKQENYSFPYLYDESQEVARRYMAACTPDFFLFNADRRLVYRGQFDDSRPGNDLPVTGNDLRSAIGATLKGVALDPQQKPSMGCNIKWKAGNEPDYFN
ncbi:MAG: thioredoxin family protein [Gammaproteobacteria bacterium]|nr:MAG: thioredoxin family protein [Gammaproteobacteria bacterium]